jgi:hypothetical protein
VAIMAAIIYAARTGESQQTPTEKEFEVVASAAWALHKAVMGGQEQHGQPAGFRKP